MSVEEQQRRFLRKHLGAEITITLQNNQVVMALGVDISINGIGFISRLMMRPQQAFRVDFELAGLGKRDKDHVSAIARVIHCTPSTAGYRIGAQFYELDRVSHEAISRFMG